MSNRTMVRNGSDREQVRRAAQEARRQRKLDLADLQFVLSSVAGRRFLFRVISRLRPNDRFWEPGDLMHYKAGRHDVAVELLNEIDEVNPDAWIQMQQEAVERIRMENVKNPPPADDDDNTQGAED